MARQPLPPPELEGYNFLRPLGTGGFADVFLYERAFPRQQVAIKVLDLTDDQVGGGERFISEANAMASVSDHPFIVSIFHAAISAGGHPYLVMEYYPGESFADRLRSERFSVAEVLRLGVQVASAIETAHKFGILHRDIKPANILTSAYGRPGLTDFGIATNREDTEAAEGLSIPWSPPEILAGEDAADERADVYSLAATLFTLLEGHSPFERPGERNRSIDLIDRIERQPVPPLTRVDAPASLSRLLSHGMAKDPAARPASAAELGRALQAVEAELRLDITPLELSMPEAQRTESTPVDIEAGSTRLKNPSIVAGQSSFATSSETLLRTPAREKARPEPSVPIGSVPFEVSSPERSTPNPAAAAGTSSEPASAQYLGAPRAPRMNVPGEVIASVDRAAWWRDRRSRAVRTVAIAAAVVAVAVVLAIVLLLGGSKSPHKGATPRVSVVPPSVSHMACHVGCPVIT